MFDVILSKAVRDMLMSLSNDKKYQFDPQPLFRAAQLSPVAKAKLRRNIATFINGPKYRNIMKILEKEFMLDLM
jgi:hypothetical protein